MRDDSRMGHDLPTGVGSFERPLHPPIEHGLVPRRQLFGGQRPCRSPPPRRGDAAVGGRWVVVGRPHGDRRMVPERVDGGAGLCDGLLANRSSVAPLEREVLQEQDPRFVGCVVQRAVGDVAVHAECVEAEVDRCVQVGANHPVGGIRRAGGGRQDVRALEEEALAVHRADPVVPLDLAQPGAALTAIAHLTVDDDLDGDLDQRLVAERSRPPQCRIGDVDRPLEVVLAGGDRLELLVDLDVVDVRAHRHRCEPVAVDARRDPQVRSSCIGVTAQHPQSIDLHGAGVVEEHWPPDPSRVEVRTDAGGGLEDAGDVPTPGGLRLRRAGDLDGEDVLVAEPRQRGDVEAVTEEVALGVAEVGAVEPDVGLVEDPVERDPSSPSLGGRRRGERVSVHQRSGARGELRLVLPMARHGDLGPPRVVAVGADAVAPYVVVGLGSQPDAGQLHVAERTPRLECLQPPGRSRAHGRSTRGRFDAWLTRIDRRRRRWGNSGLRAGYRAR